MKERASSQHDAIPFSEESRNKQYICMYDSVKFKV